MPQTASLATADAILKDLYVGPIREQLNYKTYMLDMIERDSDTVTYSGRRGVFPVEATGNRSFTAFSDGGTLAIPQAATEQTGIFNMTYFDGGVELTDQVIKIANTQGEGSFVNYLDRQCKKLGDGMRKGINTMVYGDGTGLLATLTSSPSAATTFTVDTTAGIYVNASIDVLNKSTGAAGAAGVTVTAVNKTTSTITVSSAISATTSTFGVYLTGSRNLAMQGLRSITGTGRTLFGINSATAGNEFWNGNQRNAASAVAGEGLFESLMDDVGQNGGGEIEVFLTTRGIRRRLADTYQSTKRFNDAKAVEIHGGYTAIFVNEVPVVVDDDCPKGWVFGLRKDAFAWAELEAPDWLRAPSGQGGGSDSIWHLRPGSVLGTNRAAWAAWMVWYATLLCFRPNETGAIYGAQDDAG